MYITENTLTSISHSKKIRMGLSYSKECHAPFLSRYFDDCKLRLKDICYIQKGTTITEDNAEEGDIPVVAGGKDAAYYHSTCNRKGNVITISASGANSGYLNFWEQDIWASDCITIVSKNEKKYSTKFLYYLLSLVQDDIYLMQIGADQPHVYADDIQGIRIPDIPYPIQQRALEAIIDLENDLERIKEKKISNMNDIISEVFKDYFYYDYDSFFKLSRKKFYNGSFLSYGNNKDARFSVRFHRPAGEFVYEELTSRPNQKLKKIISEPIALGASITPKEFDEKGTAYYVSMATIKTFEIELDDSQLISDKYFEKNKEKALRKNDIIIARSGVAIGKAAIIKNDFDGIFADFTMRIRVNEEKYTPQFIYYYFRSNYFQYLIEINKKGLQNQNIFPINIREFPVPDILLKEQHHITERIDDELNKQKKLQVQIEEKKQQIVTQFLKKLRGAR